MSSPAERLISLLSVVVIDMSPVVPPPIVNDCLLVVARFPAPVRNVALLPEAAEIEAVGVPAPGFMFNTANLAEFVAVEPRRKSRVDASLG